VGAMQKEFTLRAMTPQDGPAIKALSDQAVDTGAIGFHTLYQYDAYATLLALHPDARGVVAEIPGRPGIVGMGMMSLGTCQYKGALHPFAYLFSLSVHPDYRRQGIAGQLAAWRVRAARERFGADGIIFAGIQAGNTGSQRTAARWSSQAITGRSLVAAAPMRGAAPRAPGAGIEVRPAEPAAYEEIADRQNAFYAGYNLYPPRTAEALAAWHAQAPFGEPVRGYYVARDRQGNLLAGASVTEEGRLITTEIQRMSRAFRIADSLIHFFPPGGLVKRLHVKDLWYAPGRPEIGAYLWEALRWQLRERGTTMMAFLDRRSRLARVVRLPWYMPKPGGTISLAAPTPLSDERPLYFMI
jgi:predicted N-acetyltransferase YhbS